MKYLLVDLGHSRLKWACIESSYQLWHPEAHFYTLETLSVLLFDCWASASHPNQIFISNVCTLQEKMILDAWIRQHWPKAEAQYLESDSAFSGIQNAYQKAPKTLGVDRWLGIIATRYLYPDKNAIIIDCGTCITIDVLSSTAQHLGGWIVPGYALLRQMLQERAGLPMPMLEIVQKSPPLGCDTLSGIESGISLMFLGYLAGSLNNIKKYFEGMPEVILTGGDAPLLLPCFSDYTVRNEPHLVLKGICYRYGLEFSFEN